MRVGDFAVEIVPSDGGRVRELESGHVLARAGQVYRLRLRNSSPLYCVVDVDIDGERVTAGGLVIAPWSVTELERPIDAGERGRFTVVAEGDEAVFGPDGGRDNPALGLIEARFRRELPRDARSDKPIEWFGVSEGLRSLERARLSWPGSRPIIQSIRTAEPSMPPLVESPSSAIERAAGTGLTGWSDQEFVPIQLGRLESEATVLRLRLVIGTETALAVESLSHTERQAPARPAARP